ncbi:hypothetical protein [uncultured Vagococcus sp.]|uniref:hypothetical protein n=1 Tax=uncultured Vagococcus sp. TaxID=189676 RepID=UPI0028D1B4E9|nr:hypothetical protein [uncultured Vagococcus sp.]
MNVYIWLYLLGTGGVIALGLFLITFNRDNVLVKKLKLNRSKIWLNWVLVAMSILCFGLTFYLFSVIQHQLALFPM